MTTKFLLCCIVGMTALTAQSQTKTNAMEIGTKSVTCKLTTPELQKRKATVIAGLKKLILSRDELSNGFSFKFDGSDETLDKLIDFIKTERMCCDFFTFELKVEGHVALLHITGPEGAKEFLKEEADL